MTLEKAEGSPFTGKEDVYCVKVDKFFDPLDVLRILFDRFGGSILNNPDRIARVLIENKDLSIVVPLFPDPKEDDVKSADRLTAMVENFIVNEANNNTLLLINGCLNVTRKADPMKPNLPPRLSPWTDISKSLLRASCTDPLQFQVDQIEQALQASHQ